MSVRRTFLAAFMSHLLASAADENAVKQFGESTAFDFVAGSQARWKLVLAKLGFPTFQTRTHELLKNCFINHLLRKELIKISYAQGLDRTFETRSKKSYW